MTSSMSILRSFWLLVGTVIALTGSAHSQTIPPYLPPNGLIGWWPFNGNATDESFGNNDGTPVGAIRTTDRFGAIGSAYEFDGVNDYIALANPVDVGQGSLTISLYCRAQRWGDGLKESYIFGIPFIHDYDSVFQGFRFVNLAGRPLINNRVPAVNKNSFEVAIGDGRQSESYVVTQQPVFDGVWYHLVMVFNRELHTLSLFVDGQLVGVDPVDASFLDIDLGVAPTIGCQRAGYRVNSFFKGKIDDLAVWNRALSAEEIAFRHHACDFSILTQPLDAKVVQGQGATLTVVTSATNSATYRWQYQQGDDFVDLVNGADFSGVNTSSLAIQSVDSALAGRYRCEITQDDCRVFSDVVRVSLVSSDIQSYVPQSGLIGWWPFDGNASDHSGNENHGVVSGAILTNDQQGERRRAYELDGVDDFISVPWSESLAELEQKNAFTVSAWVKNYGDAPIGVFGMQHPSDDCGGWEIRTASNYLDIWFTCGSMVPCYPALPSLEWHHIAVTYASNGSTGTWRFYLNGVQVCSSSGFSGAVPTTQGGTLYVGASPLGDDEFGYGALDEIGVWNRALTDEEIRDLHTRCLAITAQPVSALGRSDGVAYFTVEARSKEPILYQWQRLTDVGFVNLSNGGGISGSTTASLVMAPFSSSLTGTYRCIVSTAACSFVSDTVTAALLGRRESSCIFNSGDPNPWPNPIQSQAGYITLGDLGTPTALSVS